ncbi:MAG: HAD-IC family P-type ATPase [Clostridiales bacterium]|nr:HAD-IC family P-type ATPase [Clostridiales bacterium]
MDSERYAGYNGLSPEEIQKRIAEGKVNGDQNIKTKSVARIFRTNIVTFFNFLFLAFAIILLFFMDYEGGKPKVSNISNFGFLGVIFVNLIIGIAQELNAKRTIDKLSLLSAPKVTVLRGGKEEDIALKDIVMDDLVILSAGRQICADSELIEGSVEVNESLITGEPDAIPKAKGDEVLSGSFVVSGNALARVIRVGKDNYATKISAGAKYIKPNNSEIYKALSRFIKLMAFIIIPLGFALFGVKYWGHGNALNDTVVTVIGTLIGMIPSGLMLLTSAVFCVSVIRLAKHKTYAQDLYCAESLARINVLCLDKTGTITEGNMEVLSIDPKIGEEEFLSIAKNLLEATGDANPTANAIKEYTKDIKVTARADSAVPFSSQRKWSAASFGNTVYALGAAETVLNKVGARTAAFIKKESEKGNRVLVLAGFKGAIKENKLPGAAKLLGAIVLSDKIRKEAPDTLRFFAEQGVDIRIISGDNALTVKCIAQRAGLQDADSYVDAATLKTDEDINEAVGKYKVFGRVTPDQKLKIVKALKAQGKVVGMTGDGVNDVLALREADCSVAMASGSDAAKNVSQLVLLDNNFASMPKVVAEGRRSINNLERSASLFLVKTGYSFLFALVFMLLSAELPFQPKHLTIIGTLTIGVPSYILALEPNKEIITGKFFNKVIRNSFPASLTVAAAVVAISLASRLFPDTITSDDVSTMCTIVTFLLGLCYIAKISYPFNFVRVVLILALAGAFVAVFFADFGFMRLASFFGLSTGFNRDMLIILIPVAVLSVPLFAALYIVMKKLDKSDLLDKALEKLKIN